MAEPLLLFESIMVEDRSIMLLVDSNYSYRSDEMASWYKDAIPFRNKGNRNRFNTGSQRFSRRSLESRREGGVITSAAALTMTSEPLRTSPIRRGAWVATVILNKPPPPPPEPPAPPYPISLDLHGNQIILAELFLPQLDHQSLLHFLWFQWSHNL